MSGELKLFEQFTRFLEKRKKVLRLTHDQAAVAAAIMATVEGRRMITAVATGKTTLFEALEAFSKEIAPKPERKVVEKKEEKKPEPPKTPAKK